MSGVYVREKTIEYMRVNGTVPSTSDISKLYSSSRNGRKKIAEALENNSIRKLRNLLDVRKIFLVPIVNNPKDLETVLHALDNTKGAKVWKSKVEKTLRNNLS